MNCPNLKKDCLSWPRLQSDFFIYFKLLDIAGSPWCLVCGNCKQLKTENSKWCVRWFMMLFVPVCTKKKKWPRLGLVGETAFQFVVMVAGFVLWIYDLDKICQQRQGPGVPMKGTLPFGTWTVTLCSNQWCTKLIPKVSSRSGLLKSLRCYCAWFPPHILLQHSSFTLQACWSRICVISWTVSILSPLLSWASHIAQ